jgi:hypothetical protein
MEAGRVVDTVYGGSKSCTGRKDEGTERQRSKMRLCSTVTTFSLRRTWISWCHNPLSTK